MCPGHIFETTFTTNNSMWISLAKVCRCYRPGQLYKRSCKTILQDVPILARKGPFSLHFVGSHRYPVGILQESCVHIPERSLQDLTKCKKKLRTFSCKNVQVLQDRFYWKWHSVSTTECRYKEAVKIHKLPKKTGDVGEKFSSGHKRENQIEKCSGEFFRMFFILFVTLFAIEGTWWWS